MDYKTSLLLYRTQTVNVNSIWKSKIRVVKNATSFFRSLNDSDLNLIKNYKTELQVETTFTKDQIIQLQRSKTGLVDITQIQSIDNQITQLKLNFLVTKNNLSIRYKNDKFLEFESHTRLLVLIYCTWSEASIIKLKHTPHGLTLPERAASHGSNIESKWRNLIDVILNRIPIGFVNDVNQMKRDLKTISEKYIVNQSILRNRIAHGQWTEAMNNENTDINLDISYQLADLDFVKVDTSFEIQNLFIEILESILESNNPSQMVIGRHDSYIILKDKLDNLINSRENWDFISRTNFLKQRTFDTRNLKIAKDFKSKGVDSQIIFEVLGLKV